MTSPCKRIDVSLTFVGVHVLVSAQLAAARGLNVAFVRGVACPLYGSGHESHPEGSKSDVVHSNPASADRSEGSNL